MSSKPKKNFLALKKKIEVIKMAEENRGMGVRELGEQFHCSKTQIAKILKTKKSILSLYSSNISSSRVVACSRKSEYEEINKLLYDWYTLACSQNIFPMGPQLVEKARQIAICLGKHEFKGSRGWLEKWKKGITLKRFKSVGSQVMSRAPLLIPGRKGFLSFFLVLLGRIFGIWMKRGFSGKLYQTEGLV